MKKRRKKEESVLLLSLLEAAWGVPKGEKVTKSNKK
jgi:hypothetical protein